MAEAIRPRDAAILEFVSLLGASASIDGPASESIPTSSKPKTRLDLLLLREEEWAAKCEATHAADQAASNPSFSFPSLSMFAPPQSADELADNTIPRRESAPDSSRAEQIASRNLGRPVGYSRSDVCLAPDRMAGTAASTFASLIGANLRQVLKTLAIRRTEMKPIKITKVSTSFSVPTDACSSSTMNTGQEELRSCSESKQVPLHFKIDYDVIIDDKTMNAHVDGTGIAICHFAPDESPLIESFNVTFDNSSLLRTLREQARIVALFALMAAASANGGRIGGNSREVAPRVDPSANHGVDDAPHPPRRCVTPEPEPDLSQSAMSEGPSRIIEDLQSNKRIAGSESLSSNKRIRF